MSAQSLIIASLVTPIIGAIGIAIAGRFNQNLREAVTLITAASLCYLVWSLIPEILSGARPELHVATVVDGIDLAFKVEPLGMVFAALASALWIVNSIYSIGYMRGNKEKNQTRFYICLSLIHI